MKKTGLTLNPRIASCMAERVFLGMHGEPLTCGISKGVFGGKPAVVMSHLSSLVGGRLLECAPLVASQYIVEMLIKREVASPESVIWFCHFPGLTGAESALLKEQTYLMELLWNGYWYIPNSYHLAQTEELDF